MILALHTSDIITQAVPIIKLPTVGSAVFTSFFTSSSFLMEISVFCIFLPVEYAEPTEMPNQIIPAAVKICGMDFDMALLTLLRFIRIAISFRNKKIRENP